MESKGNIIVVADKNDHVSARILMDALGEKHKYNVIEVSGIYIDGWV